MTSNNKRELEQFISDGYKRAQLMTSSINEIYFRERNLINSQILLILTIFISLGSIATFIEVFLGNLGWMPKIFTFVVLTGLLGYFLQKINLEIKTLNKEEKKVTLEIDKLLDELEESERKLKGMK